MRVGLCGDILRIISILYAFLDCLMCFDHVYVTNDAGFRKEFRGFGIMDFTRILKLV